MSRTYRVTARRWAHGWELHIDGVGVTQSRTLATAEQQVRDYIDTLTDTDTTGAVIDIVPELDGLEKEAAQLRELLDTAARMQVDAAAESRRVASALRSQGLSVSDTATVMHISRGRVSQLVSA